MDKTTSAYLGYGFGWGPGEMPPAIREKIFVSETDDLQMSLDMLLHTRKHRALAAEPVGDYGAAEGGMGVFVGGKSRIIETAHWHVAPVGTGMQSNVETELEEYRQLVELAKELGVDPSEIGWYVFGATW